MSICFVFVIFRSTCDLLQSILVLQTDADTKQAGRCSSVTLPVCLIPFVCSGSVGGGAARDTGDAADACARARRRRRTPRRSLVSFVLFAFATRELLQRCLIFSVVMTIGQRRPDILVQLVDALASVCRQLPLVVFSLHMLAFV